MAQFKIYGLATTLRAEHARISEVIHAAAVRSLGLPPGKRFHRFLPLEPWQLAVPADRSSGYLIVEVQMFAGRSVETRKRLVAALMDGLTRELGLAALDVEVVIIESPRENWGIRGQHGDELVLNYEVQI